MKTTTTTPVPKKVHMVSLGCPKNLVDSEIMAGTLMKEGFEIVNDQEKAETIIINTCGFIEESKKESIDRILEAAEMKNKGQLQKLVVAGCLTQRYKDDLVEGLPEADLFVGSGEFQNITKILKNSYSGDEKKTFFHLPTFLQQEATPRVNSQMPHRAYLKISEGCMKRCAFCAIPLIRGNLQSRTVENVVAEAKQLAAQGVKELIVISHDFTDYGWDLRRKDPTRKDSPVELLRELCKVEGIEWIRLLYLYPDGITPEMVDLFATEEKLVKYFDMPLQHINDDVLKSMNRKMTRSEIETVLQNIRERIPNAVLRTQFIVGFPGETQEQYEELLEFLAKNEFDRVGCFKYSPEENTPGGKMKAQVDEETKEERYHGVMSVAQRMSRERQEKMVGQTLKVVVEGLSEETELLLQGRFWGQAPEIDGVVLINDGQAEVGEFVNVRITESHDYDLVGEIVREPMQ